MVVWTQLNKKLYDRRQAWTVFYRLDRLVPGNNTNIYADAAMTILKDKIFQRVRAYNIVQLPDFLVTTGVLILTPADRPCHVGVWMSLSPRDSDILDDHQSPKDGITRIDAHNYEVRSQLKSDIVHYVDASLPTCTRTAGVTGVPYK